MSQEPAMATINRVGTGIGWEEEMEMSEGEELAPQLDETTDYFYQAEGNISTEEDRWNRRELGQKFKDVIESITRGTRRWDGDSGDPGVPILEAYKKMSLTERERANPKTGTLLHRLATQQEFNSVPKELRTTLVQFLLRHRDDSAAEEEPFLKLAMKYDNEHFIKCVMEAYPEGVADLLAATDDEGRNCLHHVFFMPDDLVMAKAPLKLFKETARRRAEMFVPRVRDETLAARDKSGNTPIHYAANYLLCVGWPWQGKYVQTFKKMVVRGDAALRGREYNECDESIILYCQHTRAEFQRRLAESRERLAEQNAATRTAEQKEQPKIFPKEQKPMLTGPSPKLHQEHGIQTDFKDRGQGSSSWAAKRGHEGAFKPNPANTVQPDFKDNRGQPSTDGFRDEKANKGRALVRPPTPRLEPRDAEARVLDPSWQGQKPPPSAPRPAKAQPPVQQRKERESVEEILEFLTLHYIRERSDLEARELIYGKDAPDKNLYFDASSLKNKTADKVVDLIGRLCHGGFGSTLSYVSLPSLQQMPAQGSETPKAEKKSYPANHRLALKNKTQQKQENPKLGRDSLVKVFDKLQRDGGVRKILRLYVEDREESPPHSDAAIERAVRGMESIHTMSAPTGREPIAVEEWDWRKPDLSTEVIKFAAPTVEIVHLYWSGIPAVLRGWSCPRDGIASFSNLKKVIINASPGLENRERMDFLLQRFRADVEEQLRRKDDAAADAVVEQNGDAKQKLKIEVVYCMFGLFNRRHLDAEARDNSGSQAEGRQHLWVARMEDFRHSLYSIYQDRSLGIHLGADTESSEVSSVDTAPERVKVALIDDGIDLHNVDPYVDMVQPTGLSFCRPEGKTESPWHQSTGGHGTIMANMILRINPWVSLQVMKIQDGSSAKGERTIFAESAAKAIRGAVRRKVDIISMSWTVKKEPGGPTDDLEKAIQEARDAKILMFCSASDDLQSGGLDVLPYAAAPDHIFRIGAADALGQRDGHSEDKKRIDYFFPGNQVAEAWNPKSAKTVAYHDGSSVATALAAGLAALIIHCTMMVRSYHSNKTRAADPEKYALLAKALRRRQWMRRAFDNIESEKWEDKKYLPVWEHFGPKADSIGQIRGERKLEQLVELVDFLCSKVKTRE